MQAMAPPRPSELQQCRIRLVSSPTAPAEARKHVRTVISVADVPVDEHTAALLTSELVTNAVQHDAGKVITLEVRVRHSRLRVEVHDSASGMPVPDQVSTTEDEDGRGLLLVDTLADEWGFYRTPTGKAVYFALLFE